MALAWKAGWVHTLTSSNLVSSAIWITALAREYTPKLAPICASNADFVPRKCPESSTVPSAVVGLRV